MYVQFFYVFIFEFCHSFIYMLNLFDKIVYLNLYIWRKILSFLDLLSNKEKIKLN